MSYVINDGEGVRVELMCEFDGQKRRDTESI